jgi:hypothetical protein
MTHPPATPAGTITEFLLARIAEDEAAARAVPPLGHNYDMGGNRQDERWAFGRTLPSSADGMGNWSPHRDSPTTAAHFSRHDPARVLAECEAKRRIVQDHATWERDNRKAWKDYSRWLEGKAVAADPPARTTPEKWHGLEHAVRVLAAVYSDHPDYRQEWKP